MKTRTLVYWVVTGLAAAFMLFSAIPDVLRIPQALAIMRHLGYPSYLLVFLGLAKVLAVTIVLVPGWTRLKEWAFAGLFIDLAGALYSHLSVGDPAAGWMPAVIGLVLVSAAYVAFRTSAASGADREQDARAA